MNRSHTTLRTVLTVLIALAVNVILDAAFDLPMLVRWGIALGAVLAVVAVIEAIRRRAASTAPGTLET